MPITTVPQSERDLSKIVTMLRQVAEGRNNAAGSFSCISNVASTLVSAVNCAASTSVLITPFNSLAAVEMGAGTVYVSSVIAGSFYVTHASTTSSRTFMYATIG